MIAHTYTLVHPGTGNLAFSVMDMDNMLPMETVQRQSHYSILLVTEGGGKLLSDFNEYDFSSNTLLCFAPYQPFLLRTGHCKGFVISFHPDFFCIHKHQHEVACNGVLFNNIYDPPFHVLDKPDVEKLLGIIHNMRQDLQEESLAQFELLVSYLKIFLITASRSKAKLIEQGSYVAQGPEEPFVLQKLKDAIETHFRQKHSAGEYAELLNITPKALARITKRHFNRTLTNMIADRIVIEAKRELYISAKPVKAIAYELGFPDEFHFSRFFKNKAAVSPQIYRTRVGFARG
ncbi:MAG TPA: helix-turn-helix domain-containing protein [Puia sp.]|jgi:AraC-like DNA-binding protein